MSTLIIKLGATGDVVRTTSLLRRLDGPVTWVTAAKNKALLENLPGMNGRLVSLPWDDRAAIRARTFDLVVSLEDDPKTVELIETVDARSIFGAHLDKRNEMTYTDDARRWFDLSLISVHGRETANHLKLANRCSYQELLFEGLGMAFQGEEYLLPTTHTSPLRGDVAIASEVGAVWPMKRWAHYDRLKEALEDCGFKVNVLPLRSTLLEHLADVRGHRCVVCGDTLPMHLAIGSGIRCVALFNCTSPWEIYEYDRLTKIVSPLLADFFYKRDFDARAVSAIQLEQVLEAVLVQLETGAVSSHHEQ